jgi:asparagine synthase (glutamine-hydrolysing)
MCGIAGLLFLDLPASPLSSAAIPAAHVDALRRRVSAMCAAMVHRGPDSEGLYTHALGGSGDSTAGAIGLGMRRLAIVDVVHGAQPMASDDGLINLVYNGEIYNAPALRAELQATGVSFRTRSDTEVLLRLYERDPHDVERHLAGMWAFAIHDRRRHKLVLSRDRFGIKPLFVADRGAVLGFASELVCFRPARTDALLGPAFELDPAAAHAMLAHGYVPNEDTIYRGVRRLAPGTRLEVDLGSGRRETRQHWQLRPSSEARRVTSLPEAVELLRPVLQRAVAEHLESDVSIATFLSGGIDSTLVTALAQDASSAPLEAYTVGFRDPRFDESPHARAVAKRLGIPLKVTDLDDERLRGSVADALIAYDEPFGDSSSLATYVLTKEVAGDHRVALGGDGGDEVFAGYRKHRIVALRERTARFARPRDLIATALSRLPHRNDRTGAWSEAVRVAGRLARGLAGTDAEAYVALTQLGSFAKTAKLAAVPADAARFVDPVIARFERQGGQQLERTLAADLTSLLPNDMLTKVDRASMAHSLEVRVPFLDHRVVELGVGLPPAFTLGGLARGRAAGKVVLREMFAQRVGETLAKRPKQGFSVPIETWLRGSLDRACERLFTPEKLERFGVLSSASLSHGRHRVWAERDPQLLWNAFALASFCEVAEGGGSSALREALDG